jgi:hypothetical protein
VHTRTEVTVQPIVTTRAAPPSPAITRVASASPSPPANPTQETPALPPIEITIGRLEIRATQPAQPAPRPRPSRAPALGLDDYLRQRGGGIP